jgi:D-alanyl-lipoteichoic acid acyltransferase DltB (MBOAT superfamily)
LAARQSILLVASLLFYGFWYPPHLVLLLSLAALAYLATRLIDTDHDEARTWTALAVIGSLVTLAYFKYSGYFLDLFQPFLEASGKTIDSNSFNIELPLGISFIAFQIIAYVVDVHQRKIAAEKNAFTFLLFVSFFPQLIAGPICRGSELMPQLKLPVFFYAHRFFSGLAIFSIGLMLKSVFADNLSGFVDGIYGTPADSSGGELMMASIGFGIQILADFWGYSTMAVGMALMFGIVIPINFNLPYISLTLQDFWRRWHMTLSSWLRDYLYIPLGGNRNGSILTYRNLFLTMLLGGLWHGASTNFVIWGAIHGVYLAIERYITRAGSAAIRNGRTVLSSVARIWTPFGYLLTMFVVFVAWVFFRADTLSDSVSVLSGIAKAPLDGIGAIPTSVWVLFLLFAVVQFPAHALIERSRSESLTLGPLLTTAFWMFLITAIFTSPDAVPFIYFQF